MRAPPSPGSVVAVAAASGALLYYLQNSEGGQSPAASAASPSNSRSVRKLRAARSMLSEGLISHLEYDRVKLAILGDLSGGGTDAAALVDDDTAEIRGGVISAPPAVAHRAVSPPLQQPITRQWQRRPPPPPPLDPAASAMVITGLGLLVAMTLMSVAASLWNQSGVAGYALWAPAVVTVVGIYWSTAQLKAQPRAAAARRPPLRMQRPAQIIALPMAPAAPLAAVGSPGAADAGDASADAAADTGPLDLVAADEMNEARDHAGVRAMLQRRASATPAPPADECVELLWRLARAKLGASSLEAAGSASRFALQNEAKADAEQALALSDAPGNTDSHNAHKWVAITTIKAAKEQGGTTESIKASGVYKEHILKAIEIDPRDANAHALLGMWCFHVAAITWLERRAASMIFSEVPSATYDDSLRHLGKAEELEPGAWSSSQLYIARCHHAKREWALAKKWCQKAIDTAATNMDVDPEELATHAEAVALLATC